MGLDTGVLIYWTERLEKYGQLVDPIFAWLERRGRAVTSTVTMLERLAQPYRPNNIDRVNLLYCLFSTLIWIGSPLDLRRVARLRGTLQLKTPDALQAGTVLAARATGFIAQRCDIQKGQ